MQNPTDMLAKFAGKDNDKSGPKPNVPYWHLWTDGSGISHQVQCALSAFELKGVGDADPQWNNKHETHASTVVITVQPVGWVGDWHENPAPQWIIVCPGAGGSKAWMAPALNRARASFRSARTRDAQERMAKKVIGRVRSGTNQPC